MVNIEITPVPPEPVEGRVQILDLIDFVVPQPWLWWREDISEPAAKGAVLRATDGPSGMLDEVAQLFAFDVSGDLEEVNIDTLNERSASNYDEYMRKAIADQIALEGRAMLRWMGSHLNLTSGRKSLTTAFTENDGGVERQMFHCRMRHVGRNIVIGCRWNIDRSNELAAPIFKALREAHLVAQ